MYCNPKHKGVTGRCRKVITEAQEQEVKQFRDFVESTESTKYLKIIFESAYFRGWVANQIRSGKPVSFMEEIKGREAQINILSGQVEILKGQIESEMWAAQKQDGLIKELQEHCDSLEDKISQMRDRHISQTSRLESRAYAAECKYLKLKGALDVLGRALRHP